MADTQNPHPSPLATVTRQPGAWQVPAITDSAEFFALVYALDAAAVQVPPAVATQFRQMMPIFEQIACGGKVSRDVLAMATAVVHALHPKAWAELLVNIFDVVHLVLPLDPEEACDRILAQLVEASDVPPPVGNPPTARRAAAVECLRTLLGRDRHTGEPRWLIANVDEDHGNELVNGYGAARRFAEALGYRLPRNRHDAERTWLPPLPRKPAALIQQARGAAEPAAPERS